MERARYVAASPAGVPQPRGSDGVLRRVRRDAAAEGAPLPFQCTPPSRAVHLRGLRQQLIGLTAATSRPTCRRAFSSTRMLAHHHAAVGRLAHVVDGEQAHLHRGQRFHLDAGAPERLDLRGAAHARAASSISKSTATRVIGSGWHSGIRSAVRLLAWMAAMRATPMHVALLRRAAWISASVAGCMRIAPAGARRRGASPPCAARPPCGPGPARRSGSAATVVGLDMAVNNRKVDGQRSAGIIVARRPAGPAERLRHDSASPRSRASRCAMALAGAPCA